MHLRYHQIVGKTVITADGQRIGAVADLVAERRGTLLRVTALQIGPLGLLRRIAFRRTGAIALTPPEVPWRLVARVDRNVHLNLDRASLQRMPEAPTATAKPGLPT
jgi:sporulation protein YlmC with PRC-barrel domain